MFNSERYPDDRDRRPDRSIVKCFNCEEMGYYANQCPHRERRYNTSRPSTSTDSRRSRSPRKFPAIRNYSPLKQDDGLRDQVAALSKGVATIKEHFNMVQAKKDEKAQRKLEREQKEEERLQKEEEEAHQSQEVARHEEKKRKKEAKAKQGATLRAELKKEVTMHAAKLMIEVKDDWIQQWKTSVLPELASGGVDTKGKKQVKYEPTASSKTDYSTDGSETSVTQGLSEKTDQLYITEKRKRTEDVSIGDSPPMEAPPKRTPVQGRVKVDDTCHQVTRARTKSTKTPIQAKRRSSIKTPLSKLLKYRKTSSPSGKLTPASRSLTRLRYRDSVMREFKDCNTDELQRFCKDEGIPYVGKIDAIFDLAEHRAQKEFPCIVPASEVIPISESTEPEVDASTENLE
ncbi:hypothetical protein CBR_g39066 [Chara braunii]|uniref:CCHC-type domain-containing protein n=1 Tax=Chara braunii TaxID=69332 RepID=A0A388LQZ8_CHABU|nr:hypothetical protein CBR_g39066 [Chara braunii]|eukprot:GBG84691.1 hypothetical protein CBR_g39066 [Chara braunii]